jgi:hypothetical protein
MLPVVSVLMPVYNGERHLQEAIESILRQTFREFEFVVVDDGSNDGTPQILASYARADQRIRVARLPRTGLIGALNAGWMLCRAPFIARMDADDVSLPQRLERQYSFLVVHPSVAVVTSAVELIDETGAVVGMQPSFDPDRLPFELLAGNPIVHGSVMIRRSAVPQEPPYRQPPEDYRLWVDLLTRKHRIYRLDEVLYQFRIHKQRYSRTHGMPQSRGIVAVQVELLRQWQPRVSTKPCLRPYIAAAWDSVAVHSWLTGGAALAAHAQRQAKRYWSQVAKSQGVREAFLQRSVLAYAWARLPWHWYQERAWQYVRTAGAWRKAFRTALVNHPKFADLTRRLRWIRHHFAAPKPRSRRSLQSLVKSFWQSLLRVIRPEHPSALQAHPMSHRGRGVSLLRARRLFAQRVLWLGPFEESASQWLASASAWSLVVVSPSLAQARAQAIRQPWSGFSMVVAREDRLPFPDRTFGVVIRTDTGLDETCQREVARVLTDDGQLANATLLRPCQDWRSFKGS